MQPYQMGFTPTESTTKTITSASASRSEENNGQVTSQTTGVTSLPQANPVFSTTPPVTTQIQGGSALGYPRGWDPATGLGMPPELFNQSSTA